MFNADVDVWVHYIWSSAVWCCPVNSQTGISTLPRYVTLA